jgi:pimeloyl-ACP methyl ester carboxylesterase
VENTALRWSSLAEEYGWVVLAPHFNEHRFNNDYQRLNLSILGTGVRADLRLNELVQEVGYLIPGINREKIYLFGFSGGGQFVHRYVAFHPERVLRAVSAGSGWYMWPSETLIYPVGTLVLLEGVEPSIRDLLTANLLVLVGTEDTTDSSFRETYYIHNDLNTIQGETRIERAANWVDELEQIAERENIDLNVELMFAQDTGHCISYELRTIASDYLTADTIPIAVRLSPWDVDRDGVVGISDLILVGRYLGEVITTQLDPNPDVNGDGEVDLLDVILVAKHFGEAYSSAAPSRDIYSLDPRYQRLIAGMHDMTEGVPGSDPDLLAARRLLDRLLTTSGTGKTQVFQNYPNPFNPETWIPYQLAQDSGVVIRIYSAAGQVIRELKLGYRKAGSHVTKDAAAYWDGTTDAGEHVPGGVYFYNIRGGNYSVTRKMTIIP